MTKCKFEVEEGQKIGWARWLLLPNKDQDRGRVPWLQATDWVAGSLLRPHPQLSRCNSLTGAMPAGCERQRALMDLRRLTRNRALHIVHNSCRIQKTATSSTRTALSTPRGDLGDFTQ